MDSLLVEKDPGVRLTFGKESKKGSKEPATGPRHSSQSLWSTGEDSVVVYLTPELLYGG